MDKMKHIALDTGNTFESKSTAIHELDMKMARAAVLCAIAVDDAVGIYTSAAVDEGDEDMEAAIIEATMNRSPLPKPGLYMTIEKADDHVSCTIVNDSDNYELITFGIAAVNSAGSKALWRSLAILPKTLAPMPEEPQAPWCACRVQSDEIAEDYWNSIKGWLRNFEPAFAWAWLERLQKVEAAAVH